MHFVKGENPRQTFEHNLDAWRRMMSDAFGPLEIRPDAGDQFSGTVKVVKRGDLQFNSLSYSGQIVERTARNVGALKQEFYTFGMPTSGPLYIKKKNIEYVLEPGCLYLTDQSVPYVAAARDVPYQNVCISIPRKALALREPNLSPFYTLKFGAGNPRAHLLAGYMNQLMAGLSNWSDAEITELTDRLLDMIVVMMVHEKECLHSGMASTVYMAQRECARTYIKTHFQNPNLDVDQVAASCGLSSGYVDWLFKNENRSIEDCIQHERLSKAHELLSACEYGGKAVSHLARQAGFSDLGQFSRAFKNQYGLSPTGFRRQATAMRHPPSGKQVQ